jgi:arylsulfatase A-like enzyme
MSLSRRQFINSSTALALASWLPGRLPGENPPRNSGRGGGKRPNIVFVMTDDQGWGDTGYNGHPWLKTPYLDAMAGNGLQLDRFYSATPKCSPTRASVLTGRHPDRFAFFNGTNCPASERFISEELSDICYATGLFGKWHLGGMDPTRANFPANKGFQRCRTENLQFDVNPKLFHEDGTQHRHEGEGSMVLVDECLSFAKEAVDRKQNFASMVWFCSPHTPLAPHPDDLAAATAMRAKAGKKARGHLPYYAEIIAVDRAMGALRQGLRDLGVEQDTVVWFCSDNGGTKVEMNRPFQGTKFTFWEGGIRVPGIIEWPSVIKPGSRSAVPVSTMDFLPTTAAMCGVPKPNTVGPVDGIDLQPLFAGKMEQRPKPVPLSWSGPVGLNDNRYKIIKGHPSVKQWKKTETVGDCSMWSTPQEKAPISWMPNRRSSNGCGNRWRTGSPMSPETLA